MTSRSNRRNRAIVDFSSQSAGFDSATRRNRSGTSGVEEQNGSAQSEWALSNETDILINSVLRFVMMSEIGQKPLSGNDMRKFLTENHTISKQQYALIITEAKKRLHETFGLRLVDIGANNFIVRSDFRLSELYLDRKDEFRIANIFDDDLDRCEPLLIVNDEHNNRNRNDRTIASSSDENDDISNCDSSLRNFGNEHGDDEQNGIETSPVITDGDSYDEMLEHSKRALLVIVLALIYMNEFPLPESELFELLNDFGLCDEMKIDIPHDVTNQKLTITKIVSEDLVRRHYLKRIKQRSENPELPQFFVYVWGVRAQIEFRPSEIVSLVKRIYAQPDNTIWYRIDRRAREDDAKFEANMGAAMIEINSSAVADHTDAQIASIEEDRGNRCARESASQPQPPRGRFTRLKRNHIPNDDIRIDDQEVNDEDNDEHHNVDHDEDGDEDHHHNSVRGRRSNRSRGRPSRGRRGQARKK